jgi:hypothetical protein
MNLCRIAKTSVLGQKGGAEMRSQEFNSLCRAVETGEERFVQNLDSMYLGKVVACGEDHLIVEAFGHRVEWSDGHCRPVERTVNPLGPPTNV